jgi:hypothetical protein
MTRTGWTFPWSGGFWPALTLSTGFIEGWTGGKTMVINWENTPILGSITEKDIFDMKPGDKFLYKAKTTNLKFKKFCEHRYMKDGSKIIFTRIDEETFLVSL